VQHDIGDRVVVELANRHGQPSPTDGLVRIEELCRVRVQLTPTYGPATQGMVSATDRSLRK
jgi:hypothetical protein